MSFGALPGGGPGTDQDSVDLHDNAHRRFGDGLTIVRWSEHDGAATAQEWFEYHDSVFDETSASGRSRSAIPQRLVLDGSAMATRAGDVGRPISAPAHTRVRAAAAE